MHTQYPLSGEKYPRMLAKADKAMERRMKIKKRKGPEVDRANRWWALWMTAVGVRQWPEK